jgi:hypothetical protein
LSTYFKHIIIIGSLFLNPHFALFASVEDITDIDLGQRLTVLTDFKKIKSQFEYCKQNKCEQLAPSGGIDIDDLEKKMVAAVEAGVLEPSGMAHQIIFDGSSNAKSILSTFDSNKQPPEHIYFFARTKNEETPIVVFCTNKGFLSDRLKQIKTAKKKKDFQFRVTGTLDCGGYPNTNLNSTDFEQKLEQVKKALVFQIPSK